MNEKMKAFEEYAKVIFTIEKFTLFVLCSLRLVCLKLDASPSKKELTKEDLDAKLSEAMGRKVDSYDLGMRDVAGAVIPHGKIKRKLFRKTLVSDGLTFSYDLLSRQAMKNVSHLRRNEEKKLKEKGVESPSHIKGFIRYLGREGDEALQNEFLSRIEVCESMNEVSGMCDEMKRGLSLNELKRRLDNLSEINAASEAKLCEIESGLDWLGFYLISDNCRH